MTGIYYNKHYNYLYFIYILLFLVWPVLGYGTGTQRYISLISENDIYAPKAQDRHYSNGLRLGFGIANNRMLPEKLRLLLDRNIASSFRNEIAFGHNIYTPENFISSEIQANDRPFAGWLYGDFTAIVNSQNIEKAIGFNIGLIGPVALGKQIQTLNHSIINDPKPLGWRNQLNNEPTILLKFRRSQFFTIVDLGGINLGLISRLGVNLGNAFTDAGSGLVFRIGSYLPNKELPFRVQPGYSGNSTYIEARDNQFDWQLYTEIQGRGVLHNIFLDGNTFTNSHSVRKKPFVWESSTGLVLSSGHFKYPINMAFTLTWRSREFQLQRGTSNFGSAIIGVQF